MVSWLVSLLPGGWAGVFAYFRGLDWGWAILVGFVVYSASVFLADKAYWRFGYCPMKEAATKVYTALRHEPIGKIIRHFSDETPESVLCTTAGYIANNVPVYGIKPPSSQRDVVTQIELAALHFHQEGNALHSLGNPRPFITEVQIKRADVGKAIALLRPLSV